MTNKNRSGHQEMMTNTEQRPWGSYTLLFSNINFKDKAINFNVLGIEGKSQLPIQQFNDKDHYFSLLDGEVLAYRSPPLVEAKEFKEMGQYLLREGGNIVIPKRFQYAFSNVQDEKAKVLEFSIGEKNERSNSLYSDLGVDEGKLSLKVLSVLPGAKLSVQTHEHRGEFWYVLSGNVNAYRGEKQDSIEKTIYGLECFSLSCGENILIPANKVHSLENKLDVPAKLLEFSFGHYDEKDITRLGDIYGRVR